MRLVHREALLLCEANGIILTIPPSPFMKRVVVEKGKSSHHTRDIFNFFSFSFFLFKIKDLWLQGEDRKPHFHFVWNTHKKTSTFLRVYWKSFRRSTAESGKEHMGSQLLNTCGKKQGVSKTDKSIVWISMAGEKVKNSHSNLLSIWFPSSSGGWLTKPNRCTFET